jgi:nucleoside-diphosphate-sugar epimerase
MDTYNILIIGGVGFIGSHLVEDLCGNAACRSIILIEDFLNASYGK